MSFVLIFGIAVICSLLLVFSLTLKQEHFLLKLLLYFAFFYMLIFIPKIMTTSGSCDWLVANSTLTFNTTVNEYSYTCSSADNTAIQIFERVNWLAYIFAVYMFFYFNYVLWFKSRLMDWGVIKK